ncbi:DNA cytosine methyltransferase [bacterium]|nr:DNA cytosine methyltransferase [bacterium]
MLAGWNGLFAVEQDALAFGTLKHNLIDGHPNCPVRYNWPDWIEKTPIEIRQFIRKHRGQLAAMKGQVALLAGGPPCQGFSLAGRRKSDDPRNELFKHYVTLVKILAPPFLILENVKGISVAFRKQAHANSGESACFLRPFSERIKRSLTRAGYAVFTQLVHGTDVGVPQFRPRYIMLAIRRDLLTDHPGLDPFADFHERREKFLKSKGLPVNRPVTVRQAISDLEVRNKTIIDCVDSARSKQIKYKRPLSKYQRLLHGHLNGTAPNSMRLANHGEDVTARFTQILETCRKGVQLSASDRERFHLKKHCTVPLDPDRPSHTLTTLPDDLLHYSEPRVLTVREFARLQSFPDWYEFKGKYSTGGDRRLRECPRYTQAGNAVPPFLAEFVGRVLADLWRKIIGMEETCR